MALGDNEITLVDEESQNHYVLLFSHDSIIRCTLSEYPSGKPVYRIRTNDNDSRTDFYAGGSIDKNALIGSLKSGLFGRTIVRHEEKTKLSKWLLTDGTYFTSVTDFPMSFCSGGQTFEWRLDDVGQLALYNKDAAEDGLPVAWNVRSKKRIVDGKEVTYRAYLVFTSAVAVPGKIRDDILFSWRVASATIRANEMRHERRKLDATSFLGGSGIDGF